MLDNPGQLCYTIIRKRKEKQKKKEVKKMKKIVKYAVVNKKNNLMGRFDTEAEAKAEVEKAAKRGWVRFIEKIEWEIKDSYENWEYEGAMVDPESINWEKEEW